MFCLIFTVMMFFVGMIRLNTPSPLLTPDGKNDHRRSSMTQIVVTLGIGSIITMLEFQYGL